MPNLQAIEDIGQADDGLARLEWVRSQMPILAKIKAEFKATRPFEGLRIGICLHVEAKTGIWIETLQAGGAEIAITGSPGTTQDEVAAALVRDYGCRVFTRRRETYAEHLDYAARVLDTEPDLLADNGADLHQLLAERSALRGRIRGATEETTTGGYRLRHEIEAFPFPTVIINDSRAKRIIENRYGVGQSVVDGLMRATNGLLGGKKITVVGYGFCGQGVARRLKGLGARVQVADIDPLALLEAHLEGFQSGDLTDLIPQSDMIVTVTGHPGILVSEYFLQMKDGVILANAGHFEFEIDIAALEQLASSRRSLHTHIEAFSMPENKTVYLLARGNLVNLAVGDGNPIEVMDLGLALQSLSLAHLAKQDRDLPATIQGVPHQVETRVAQLALAQWTA
jgi:adenosylhomocysteinase